MRTKKHTIYIVTSELYNQEPNNIIAFAEKKDAINYLNELAKTFKQNDVSWHHSKEKFIVKCQYGTDKFYIDEMAVY